jgi:Protein of unknown function (DUF3306)
MAFDEGFLARWSRRKAESHLPSGSVDSTPPRDPAPDMNLTERSSDEPATDLDCGSLEFSSDFSRFVCDGISTTVQTAALRRLWLTSPLFNTSDGLDVYRADYARASPLGDIPEAASRALQMIAGEQSTADRPAPPLAVTSSSQNDIAPCLEEQESQPAQAQEPQSRE